MDNPKLSANYRGKIATTLSTLTLSNTFTRSFFDLAPENRKRACDSTLSLNMAI